MRTWYPEETKETFWINIVNRGTKGSKTIIEKQGGRTWQPFVGGKNGHENFRQARIYNFCDKCVVFAHNLKFSNLTQ